MANETTAQALDIQENLESDENIPPGVISAAGAPKLKVQVEDVIGCSSPQRREENKTLSDSFTFATPAPAIGNGGGKTKSRLSTLQSALTPVLKCLNIGNKCPSLRSAGGTETPVYCLADESLPEITLLDDTCDSAMHLTRNDSALPDSTCVTPVTTRFATAQRPQFSFSTNLKLNPEVQPPKLPKHINTTAGTENNESKCAPEFWLVDYFPEITLLDITRDSEVGEQISPVDVKRDVPELGGQISSESGRSDMIQSEERCLEDNTVKTSLETTRDITMGSVSEHSRSSSEPSEQSMVKLQTSAEDTLGSQPANVTHDISSTSGMSAQCPQVCTSDMECNTSSKTVTSGLLDEHMESPGTVETNSELQTSHDTKLTSKVPQLNSTPDVSVNGTFSNMQPSDLSTSTNLNTTRQISGPQNNTIDLPLSNACSPKVENESTEQAASVTIELSLDANQNCSAVKGSGPCAAQNATFDKHSLQKSSDSIVMVEAAAATLHVQNNTFDCKPPSKQNGTITLSETNSSDSHQSTMDKLSSPKVCNLTASLKENNSEVHPPEMSENAGKAAPTDDNVEMAETPDAACEADPVVKEASGAGRRDTKDHSQSGLPPSECLSDTLNQQSMDSENSKRSTFNLDDSLDLRADCLVTSTPMTKNFNFATLPVEGKTIGAQKKLYGDGVSKPADQVPSDIPSNLVCDRKTFFRQPATRTLCLPSKVASHLWRPKPASALPAPAELRTSCLPMKRQRTQVDTLKNAAASDAPQGTTGISSSYNLRPTTTGLRRPQLSGIPSGIQRAAPGLRPPSARSNTQASSSTDRLCGPTAVNPVTKTSQAKKHPLTRGEALPLSKRKKMDVPSSGGEAPESASDANKKALKQPATSQKAAPAKTQRDAPASTSEVSTTCDATSRARALKAPAGSQRAVPAKTKKDEAAVPTSAAVASTACDASSRARALKPPANSHKNLLSKPQAHGCANCSVLEQQLKVKSEEIKRLNEGCGELAEQLKEKEEEIRRLKEELLKYSKQEEEANASIKSQS
ncbi:uncharacterized protein LOC110969040 isoform X2 [Acanthochromis polyacanthus]|uniref:uncharacterized protein LOC110969040 isoform X2 n=1 Tax=Acanthochromis polyacanthus TaxID=80966 RepID=UPI002234CCF8|nr:uncharacterized protein LOC110969040 isoform X2 [Acanthochromis polyacanthus]